MKKNESLYKITLANAMLIRVRIFHEDNLAGVRSELIIYDDRPYSHPPLLNTGVF